MANRRLSIQSIQPEGEAEIFATVSGSFNKFWSEVQETTKAMIAVGIIVLSPRRGEIIGDYGDFVILEEDNGSPKQIESRHLQAIGKSDFLYIVNPGGYIGSSVALEIGYALSKGIPIYAQVRPRELIFSDFVSSELSLVEIKETIAKGKKKLAGLVLRSSPTIKDLQKYVSAIIKARGFSEEGLVDVALLFVEEVGELAKAIRFDQGLKLSSTDIGQVKSIDSELADCLIYLFNLANLVNVDLEKAIREKEAVNSKRKWQK